MHNITRRFGWRIHCGVVVTELSTDKQHTLSRTSALRAADCNANTTPPNSGLFELVPSSSLPTRAHLSASSPWNLQHPDPILSHLCTTHLCQKLLLEIHSLPAVCLQCPSSSPAQNHSCTLHIHPFVPGFPMLLGACEERPDP
jgi:hypothetical protein